MSSRRRQRPPLEPPACSGKHGPLAGTWGASFPKTNRTSRGFSGRERLPLRSGFLRNSSASLEPIPKAITLSSVNSHHPLWDPSGPADAGGERIVHCRLGQDIICHNTGPLTWRKTNEGLAQPAPDITSSHEATVTDWNAQFFPDSGHAWITFEVQVGEPQGRPITFKGSKRPCSRKQANRAEHHRCFSAKAKLARSAPATTLIKIKEPKCARIAHRKRCHRKRTRLGQLKTPQPPRIPAEDRKRTTAHSRASELSSILRRAVTRSVPCAVATRPPFWTPEPTLLDKPIGERRGVTKAQLPILHGRKRLKEIAVTRWRERCRDLDTTTKVNRHPVQSIYALCPIASPVPVVKDQPPSRKAHTDLLAKMRAKKSTRHPKAPHPELPSLPPRPFAWITMGELSAALRDLHLGSAPGSDNIHAESLANLPVKARVALVHLFNATIMTGQEPVTWKGGTIIPLLKPGKPADDPASFRPVTLTSNLCK